MHARLRLIGFIDVDDGTRRRGRESQCMRLAPERIPRVDDRLGADGAPELDRNTQRVAVHNRHPVALSAHGQRRKRHDPVCQLAENLEGLGLQLLFFTRYERDDVVDDLKAGYTRNTGSGNRL